MVMRVTSLFLNPLSLSMIFPCPFTQTETGELKIVQIPGILCSWLNSREKEFVFGLYVLQVRD